MSPRSGWTSLAISLKHFLSFQGSHSKEGIVSFFSTTSFPERSKIQSTILVSCSDLLKPGFSSAAEKPSHSARWFFLDKILWMAFSWGMRYFKTRSVVSFIISLFSEISSLMNWIFAQRLGNFRYTQTLKAAQSFS